MNSAENSSDESPLSLPLYGGCLQFDVRAGECGANRATVAAALEKCAPSPGSLIVLPELWAGGFDYSGMALHAEQTEETLSWLTFLASRYQVCLAGSLPEKRADSAPPRCYNTLFFIGPNGLIGGYRKQNLFLPMGESAVFDPGDNPRAIHTPLGVVAALVCFDLRFPQLAASQVAQGAGVIVVSAQWPEARLGHWRTLLQARAIENQAYVIACNRCGTTENTSFAGHSMIIAPDGVILAEAQEEAETLLVPLNRRTLSSTRIRFRTAAHTPYRFHDADKVCELAELLPRVAAFRRCGRKMVFTNGCFDLLHEGHVTYLEAARRLGDYLIVGLNSDSSIRAIKGPERPINAEQSRARLLAALGCVDHVVLFSEHTPHALIVALSPDILVKGADWPVENIVGAREVLDAGGEVKTIEFVGDFSTTALLEKIKNPR